MKVLMKKDLKKVGKAGQIIDVSDGYGANYLIPNGYAVLYTAEAQKQYDIEFEEHRILDAKKRQEEREQRPPVFSSPLLSLLSSWI